MRSLLISWIHMCIRNRVVQKINIRCLEWSLYVMNTWVTQSPTYIKEGPHPQVIRFSSHKYSSLLYVNNLYCLVYMFLIYLLWIFCINLSFSFVFVSKWIHLIFLCLFPKIPMFFVLGILIFNYCTWSSFKILQRLYMAIFFFLFLCCSVSHLL